MHRFGTSLCVVLMVLPVPASADGSSDPAVISACVESRVDAIEDGITGQLREGTIFIVNPPKAKLGMMSRGQIAADFEDGELKPYEALLDDARRRSAEGWSNPPGITVSGHPVLYEAPPARTSYIADTSFAFWAPGYSDDGTIAFVRGSFTPSVNGATINCVLRRQGEGWSVSRAWLRFYL